MDRYRPRPPPPPLLTITEYIGLLKTQLACFPTSCCYLVIDALDKCEDEARSELCEDLQDLPENAYLLITSRDVPELEGQINSSGRLLIRADDNDIEMYLEGRIEQMNRSKRQTDTDPGLRLLVTTTIRDKAQGMYVSLSGLNNTYAAPIAPML